MTPIFDHAVLDLLPLDATVWVSVPAPKYPPQRPTRVFHLVEFDCGTIGRPTEPTTLAEARERGLGLCVGCVRTAQKRKRLRDAGA